MDLLTPIPLTFSGLELLISLERDYMRNSTAQALTNHPGHWGSCQHHLVLSTVNLWFTQLVYF